jgi:hypothetical protein
MLGVHPQHITHFPKEVTPTAMAGIWRLPRKPVLAFDLRCDKLAGENERPAEAELIAL